MRPARVSARPRRRSASARSMTPLSEDRRPPSNAAVTFLELTDGNVKVIGGSSFIAGYLGERRNHDALATRSLCKLNALRHTERSNFVAGGIRWARDKAEATDHCRQQARRRRQSRDRLRGKSGARRVHVIAYGQCFFGGAGTVQKPAVRSAQRLHPHRRGGDW